MNTIGAQLRSLSGVVGTRLVAFASRSQQPSSGTTVLGRVGVVHPPRTPESVSRGMWRTRRPAEGLGFPQELAHAGVMPRRKIGEGNLGVVYEVDDKRDLSSPQRRAVKVAKPETSLNFLSEFIEQEIAIGFKLAVAQVGGVVAVQEAQTLKTGQKALFMKYIDGDDLADRIDAWQENLAAAFLISNDIFLDILDILMGVHQAGIVHRDIKPKNIRLDRAGRVFLLDFGCGIQMGTSQARFQMMPGAPKYMSRVLARQFSDSVKAFREGEIDASLVRYDNPMIDAFAAAVLYCQMLGVEAVGSQGFTDVDGLLELLNQRLAELQNLGFDEAALTGIYWAIERTLHLEYTTVAQMRADMAQDFGRLEETHSESSDRFVADVQQEIAIPTPSVVEQAVISGAQGETGHGSFPRRGLLLGAFALLGIGWAVVGREDQAHSSSLPAVTVAQAAPMASESVENILAETDGEKCDGSPGLEPLLADLLTQETKSTPRTRPQKKLSVHLRWPTGLSDTKVTFMPDLSNPSRLSVVADPQDETIEMAPGWYSLVPEGTEPSTAKHIYISKAGQELIIF